MSKLIPKTSGERLFLTVRETIDNYLPGEFSWGQARMHLEGVGGNEAFASYVEGAVAVHIMKRLLRYWASTRPMVSPEAQHVKRMKQFIVEEVIPGLDESQAFKLARAVLLAEQDSGRPVTPAVRKAMLKGRKLWDCYLCGRPLDSRIADETAVEHLTAEHLWPCSLGGNSIEDNLLPACTACQKAKKDSMSWEWVNVHDIVLPPSPSEDALKSIPWPVRIARHYFHIIAICQEERLTLKNGFLKVGPIRKLSCETDLPATFFDIRTA